MVNVAGNYIGKVVNHSFHSAYWLLVPSLSALLPSVCVCGGGGGGGGSSVQFSSVQFEMVSTLVMMWGFMSSDVSGIYALGKALICAPPRL